MKLGEFFLSIAVDATTGELTIKNLISSMGDLEAITVANIGVLFEMANALAQIVTSNISAALNLDKTTQSIDTSSEAIQRWQHVAKMTGLSGEVESVTQALKTATSWVEKLKLHGLAGLPPDAIKKLRFFGIDPMQLKDADDLMRKLRESVQSGTINGVRVTKDAMHAMLQTLGSEFSDSQRVFEESGEKFNFAWKHTPIITPKDMADAEAITAQMDHIEDRATAIGHRIFRWSAPLLEKLLDTMDSVLTHLENLRIHSQSDQKAHLDAGWSAWAKDHTGSLGPVLSGNLAGAFDWLQNAQLATGQRNLTNFGIPIPQGPQQPQQVTVKVEGTIGPDKPAFLQWFHDEWNKMEKAVQQQLNPQISNAPR